MKKPTPNDLPPKHAMVAWLFAMFCVVLLVVALKDEDPVRRLDRSFGEVVIVGTTLLLYRSKRE